MRNDEIKNEIDQIKKCENKMKRKDLKYETNIYIYIYINIYIYIYIYMMFNNLKQ